METVRVCLGADSAEVLCVYKRIKNIHLKVYPDGRVTLTAPFGTEREWVANYLDSKREWIFRARRKYEGAERPEEGKICLFGVSREIVCEKEGRRPGVSLEPSRLVVRLSAKETAADRRVERFVRETAEKHFSERAEVYFPVVRALGAKTPEIKVRRMKSMWGNCNKGRGTIRFNTVLLCADPECIDYVVLHELTHLLIAGHQQDFHRFMTREMPDWKIRRKRLNKLYAKYL